MKNKRNIIAIIIYAIMTPFSFAQSAVNSRIIDIENEEQIFLFKNKHVANDIYNINSLTGGSPFNNKDNLQIDSVVIKKLYSGPDYEIVKYYYTYDSLGNVTTETKTNYWRLFNKYDSEGNIINERWEFWQNNQWENDTYESHFYDSTGKRVLYLNQRWGNAEWVDNYKVKYLYTSNNDLSSYVREDWDDNQWVNSLKKTYFYDSNYVLISTLNQNWGEGDWSGTTWRNTYTYDTYGKKTIDLSEDLINNQWTNDIRWRYEYDKKNYNILTFYELWEENNWIPNYRWTNTYNNNGKVVWYLEETSDYGRWINSYQTFSTYNSKGYFSFAKSEMWLESDSIWVPGNEGIFIYDREGNRRSYFGAEIKVYYHDEATDINIIANQQEDFYLSQNYPNPFNPSTTIKYSIIDRYNSRSNDVKLKIFNILGEEIVTLVDKEQKPGVYEISFNGSGLPSGIYMYVLSFGDFEKSRKMILIK